MKENINRDLLEELYFTRRLSRKLMAKELKISRNSLRQLLEKYSIEKNEDQIIQDAKLRQIKPSPDKDQLFNDYIIKNLTIADLCKKYSSGKNKIHRLLEKYKIEKDTNSIVKTRENTNLKRYGFTSASKNSEIREKIIKANSDPELLKKIVEKKRDNGTYNYSKDQKTCENLLIEKFGIQDIFTEYSKDKRYPYPCDFYIKSLDLFIEYQGTWCHGDEPFDSNNPKHLEIVNKLKEKGERNKSQGNKKPYQLYTLMIWTKRDPLKRKIAKDNNLNFLEFFNMKEFLNWYNSL